MDDLDHVWEFLKRLPEGQSNNYRGQIRSRLDGFKHWNPNRVGDLRDRIDHALRGAQMTQAGTMNFELSRQSLWLGVLAEARENLG